MASAVNQPTKEKPDEPQRRRSIFELPQDFFDSCHLLRSPSASISDYTSKLSIQNFDDAVEESKPDEEIISNNNDVDVNNSSSYKNNNVNVTQRWSCNTCKVEFESLQDQRSHFKSDIHRFNVLFSLPFYFSNIFCFNFVCNFNRTMIIFLFKIMCDSRII